MIEQRKEERYCEEHDIKYTASIVALGGKDRESPCPKCSEAHKSHEDEIRQRVEQENNQKRIEQTFMRSGIPPRYTTRTIANFNADTDEKKKALSAVTEYVETITEKMNTGAGLILAGKPGTGKTHLACAVGSEFVNSGGSVLFITVSAMIRKIRETYRKDSEKTEQEAINSFRDIELLIIDEIGVQKGSESEENLLFEIINERYNYFRPTIMISNLNAEEMKKYIGARTLDRMREGGGKFVGFTWDSYRAKVSEDKSLPKADEAIYRGKDGR